VFIDPNFPTDKPETQQMKVIHRAMRREFAQLPPLIAATGTGDTARAGRLGGHLTLVLGMLHEHHEAEDALLWPILIERVPIEKDLIETMERQHDAVGRAATAIEAALPGWIAAADPATRDRLAGGLRDLGAALTEHLDLEESAVLPLIHDHLTLSEWLAPQKHAMKNGPKSLSAKLTMAGLILQDATPPERAWFLHEMPPPARLLWRLIGARQYRSGLQWRGSLG